MKTYIVLLRGINVSGQKKIKMAALRNSLKQRGLEQLETYIQSGNIVCKTKEIDSEAIEKLVHEAILKDFGFDVPTLVLLKEELEGILKHSPYLSEEEKSQYFVFLKQTPNAERIEDFNKLSFDHEDFHITTDCVYLCCKAGYGKAKLSNNLVERKLQVSATARNLKTVRKLLELCEA